MVALNAMQKALVNAGLAEAPKERKHRQNNCKYVCKKCGTRMVQPDGTNVMYCPNCDKSFFIFDKKK